MKKKMNNKLKRGIFLLLVLVFQVGIVSAQSVKLRGTIIEQSTGEPVPGVTIVVKGTTNGTISDMDGNYSIEAPMDGVLQYSFLGFSTQEVEVKGKSKIDIALISNMIGLDEVIAVGYGSMRKKELTGAVARVKTESLEKIATANFTEALQGQVAGVNVQASSGEPGAGINVQIRGVGSFSAGALGPLYVVDGVPYDGDPGLSANEIESIDILKDAASAAIYGTRASGGVILVTTKKGEAGTMKVNFDAYYGVQKITSGIELANTTEALFINQLEQLSKGDGETLWNPLEQNPNGLYYDTDWLGDLTVDNAPIQNYNLRVSGGKKDLTYSINTTYFSQDGVLVSSGYERLSLRANTHFEKNKFSMNTNIGMSMAKKDNAPWGLQYDAIKLPPYQEGINTNDNDITATGTNPEYLGNIARKLKEVSEDSDNGFSASIDLNYEILKGLKLRANLGGNVNNTFKKYYQPKFIMRDVNGEEATGGEPFAKLTNQQNYWQSWITEFMASYDKSFNKHNFKLLAGYTMEEKTWRWFKAGKDDFLSNDIQVLSGGAINPSSSGELTTSTIQGMLGRMQYNYDDKYLFSASVRRDGSSKFGADYRYGSFPSVSLGWNISEESFFKNSGALSFINNMKLRASYGTTGNQSISDYSYAATVNPALDYVLGYGDQNSISLGAIQQDFATANVKWETSVARNIGLDLSMFEGKLYFAADYYNSDKNDMLFPVTIPTSSGSSQPVVMNVGDMVNKGVELLASYHKTNGNFKYNFTATFSHNVNEVTKTNLSSSTMYGGEPIIGRPSDPITVIKEGLPAGTFLLIPTDGIISTEEELEEYIKYDANAQLGDLKYVNTNGDDKINDDDRIDMGSGAPDFEAGLTANLAYKNFDFSLQLYGVSGNKVYNGSKLYSYLVKRNKELAWGWSDYNPTSTIPAPRSIIEHENTRSRSDYFLEDGSYLRIRNIQLGYAFSKSQLEKINISKCRVYVSAQNPFTFTKYTGFDPEVGNDGLFFKGVDRGNYPVAAQYRMGIQLEF